MGWAAIAPMIAMAADQPVNAPLSFSQTLRLAEQSSPSLGVVKNDLNIAELEKKNALSVFFPQLDLKSNHEIFRNSTDVVRPGYDSSLGVYLTQTIYDNHLSITRYESASLSFDLARLRYDNARDRLYLEVAEEYFDYSLSKKLYEVKENQFNIIRKQFQTLQAQYQNGLKTRRDYLRFKSDLRRSEIDLESAKAGIARATTNLYRVIGIDQVASVQRYQFVPLDIELKAVEKVPTVAPDITTHYRYRIAGLQRRIFENDVYIVKRDYWPVVSLSAGAYHAYNDYWETGRDFSDTDSNGWSALLSVNFSLWDWGTRRRNVQIASERRSRGEREIAADLNEFSAESQNTMINLEQSSKNYKLGRELLDLESTNYNFLEREYRDGRVAYLDLVTSLRNLLDAKVTLYSNYFELRSQILRYHYNEGTLYEHLEKI